MRLGFDGVWGPGGFAAGSKGVWELGSSAGQFLQFFDKNNRIFMRILAKINIFKQ